MLPTFPAFVGGFPGGVELAVIFLIGLLFAVVPFALLVVAAWYFVRHSSGRDMEARIAELEEEVSDLERELRQRDE